MSDSDVPRSIEVECAPRTNIIAPWREVVKNLLETADADLGLTGETTLASAKGLDASPEMLESELWSVLRDMTEDVRNKIELVRLTLKNYAQSLGIGLVSARADLLDAHGEPVALPDGEESSLTIGSVLPAMPLYAQALVRFNVSAGCEELTPVGGNLTGRTYSRGERMNPVTNNPVLRSFAGNTLHATEPLIVPRGSAIALSVPVLDARTLMASGLEHMEILPERDPLHPNAVLYVCRYRTHQAALGALGKRTY